jgi:hypothetical protein
VLYGLFDRKNEMKQMEELKCELNKAKSELVKSENRVDCHCREVEKLKDVNKQLTVKVKEQGAQMQEKVFILLSTVHSYTFLS